jgi:hypothetical protein
LKGKIKYVMKDMKHRHLFVNSLLPHLKYPLQQQQLEENQYHKTNPAIEEMKVDMKNLTFQLNQNRGKNQRESIWCTTCRTEGDDKNEFPTFV